MLTKRERILRKLQKTKVLRARDLKSLGVSGAYLVKLAQAGVLDRPARGLYTAAGTSPTEFRTLIEATLQVPQGLVCLLSALQFHQLTTQAPLEVWLAIDVKARKPAASAIPIRIVRFSGSSLVAGVEVHKLEGVKVRITSPAKTVVDCFKYRHKLGLEVALEALRDVLRQRKATRSELWRIARVCRMTNVMRPYLEAVS